MNISKLRTQFASAATVIGLGLGMASSAMASPAFKVDPNALPNTGLLGTPTVFTADSISGTSSELLALNPITNTASGDGWVQFTSFNLLSAAINPLTTGININYGLYATFHLEDILTSGSLGAPGSTYALTALDLTILYDPSNNNSYNAADATSATAATVGDTTLDDIILGTAHLVFGNAGLNDPDGAFLNSLQTFALTLAGEDFFIDPVPFYNLALDGFNNAGGGVEFDPLTGLLSINDAVGVVDFAVPEPDVLALLGIAFVGLGALRRRNRRA